MHRPRSVGTLARFVAGSGGSILAGLAIFRLDLFDPTAPQFHCVIVGTVAAGILALIRARQPLQAAALVVSFSLVHLGHTWSFGLLRAAIETAWSLFTGVGAFVVAVVFDRLAEMGFRFGKFLLVGTLMGGVYLGGIPLILLVPGAGPDGVASLLLYALVGILIGDGLGLGVELVELLTPVGAPSAAR